MLIVCDIDGTIADVSRRLKLAGPEPEFDDVEAKDAWVRSLHKTLSEDVPIPGMRELLHTLVRQHVPLIYLTGRSQRYWVDTYNWLSRWQFPMAPIYMRDNDDWRPAAQYKEQAMKKFVPNFTHPIIVLDDDGTGGDCHAMYERNGWRHLKV